MKKRKFGYLLLGTLIAGSFLFPSCQESKKEKDSAQTTSEEIEVQEIKKAQLTVYGMTCTGCEKAIEKKVLALTGIISIEATHTDSSTVVVFDTTRTSIRSIQKAIEETGYEVKKTTLLESP